MIRFTYVELQVIHRFSELSYLLDHIHNLCIITNLVRQVLTAEIDVVSVPLINPFNCGLTSRWRKLLHWKSLLEAGRYQKRVRVHLWQTGSDFWTSEVRNNTQLLFHLITLLMLLNATDCEENKADISVENWNVSSVTQNTSFAFRYS